MAPHTTTEMRERMVVWRSEFGKTDSEIAALAGCSERTVREVLRLHREYGVVRNPHVQPCGRHRALATADLNYLSSLLDANPCLSTWMNSKDGLQLIGMSMCPFLPYFVQFEALCSVANTCQKLPWKGRNSFVQLGKLNMVICVGRECSGVDSELWVFV
jgi:hypothetical protein